ncbi:hypothetical protein [Nesterenkonia pannonica]|uniref:hypothetical protein n=1 Tax=Nesterenkonia pannonica TaxID=1548602 RepID=UPI00216438BD|nr:hypothetical protein [Nesterenkonia pannonica]
MTALPAPVAISDEALRTLRSSLSPLTTIVGEHLENELSWYATLSTEERASLRLIAQRGISTGRLAGGPGLTLHPLVNELLGPAPTDLMRSISSTERSS